MENERHQLCHARRRGTNPGDAGHALSAVISRRGSKLRLVRALREDFADDFNIAAEKLGETCAVIASAINAGALEISAAADNLECTEREAGAAQPPALNQITATLNKSAAGSSSIRQRTAANANH